MNINVILRVATALVMAAGFSLAATPAYAGYRVTLDSSPSSAAATKYKNAVKGCVGYNFDTFDNMRQCFLDRAPNELNDHPMTISTSKPRYYRNNEQCIYRNTNDFLVKLGNFYFANSHGRYAVIDYKTVEGYQMYSNSSCTEKAWGGYFYYVSNYSYDSSTPEPGGEGPEPEEVPVCRLPVSFANSNGYPKGSITYLDEGDGFTTPNRGSAFMVGRQSGIDNVISMRQVNPEATLSDLSNTPSGAMYTEDFNLSGNKCIFRRFMFRFLHKPTNQTWYVVQVMNGAGEPDGTGANAPEDPELTSDKEVLIPNERKSKPIIAYGTRADADLIARQTAWIKELVAEGLAVDSAQANAQEKQNDQITVATDWSDKPTTYTHPSPVKLVRDNPEFADQFEPRAGWKESEQPADENTQKGDLVRLSNDGQSIVHNNTSVYNNTYYPPVMVNAGNAPPNTSPPGSPDRPGDGTEDGPGSEGIEGLEGDIAQFEKCYENYEDEDCKDSAFSDALTDAANAELVGALPDSEGWAGNMVSEAISKGRCSLGETSVYCSLIAAIAPLTSPSTHIGDFNLFETEIQNPLNGESIPWVVTIPDYVVAFLKLLTSIVMAITGFRILINWRGD